mgnify:CR=1 FL=1
MATSKQIKAYATANNCSTAEAKDHLNEDHREGMKARATWCRLFIKKTNTKTGDVEFILGDVTIPDPSDIKEDRDQILGALGSDWKHDEWPLGVAAGYLGTTMSFQFAKDGLMTSPTLFGKFFTNTGGGMDIDLDNLGCVIEFEVEGDGNLTGVGIGTYGPKWMSPSKVDKIASKTIKKYKKSHSIIGEVA